MGDITLYLLENQAKITPQKESAIVQLIRRDFQARQADCAVGVDLKFLETSEGLESMLTDEKAAVSRYKIALWASTSIQRALGSFITQDYVSDVHHIYAVVREIFKNQDCPQFNDTYRPAFQERISGNKTLVNQAAQAGPVILSYLQDLEGVKQHRPLSEAMQDLSSFVELSTGSSLLERPVADAILIAYMKKNDPVSLTSFHEDAKIRVLFLAAKAGRQDIFTELSQSLPKGQLSSLRDDYGFTLLEASVLGGKVEIFSHLKNLLGTEFNQYVGNLDQTHPNLLSLAAEYGNTQMLVEVSNSVPECLVGWLTQSTAQGYTPYHQSIISGNVETYLQIIRLHERVQIPTAYENLKTGQTALHLASDTHNEMFSAVLDHSHQTGCNLNLVPNTECIPILHNLMLKGDTQKLERFLEKKPNLFLRDKGRRLPFEYGHSEATQLYFSAIIDHLVACTQKERLTALKMNLRSGDTFGEFLAINFPQSLIALVNSLKEDHVLDVLRITNPNTGFSVAHRLAQYQGVALASILNRLNPDRSKEILSIQDLNRDTVAHYFAYKHGEVFALFLNGLNPDRAENILSIPNPKTEESVAHSLARFHGEALASILKGVLKYRTVVILSITHPKTRQSVAQFLAAHQGEIFASMLKGELKDRAVEILRDTNSETGDSLAHYLVKFYKEVFTSILNGLPPTSGVEILRITNPKTGYILADFLAQSQLATFTSILNDFPPASRVEILGITNPKHGNSLAHYLAKQQGEAFASILNGLPPEHLEEIFRITNSKTNYSVAHYLADFNADKFISILEGLIPEYVVEILRITNSKHGNSLARYLAEYQGEAFASILNGLPQASRAEILRIINSKNGNSLAHYLAEYQGEMFVSILNHLPRDYAVEILSIINDNPFAGHSVVDSFYNYLIDITLKLAPSLLCEDHIIHREISGWKYEK